MLAHIYYIIGILVLLTVLSQLLRFNKLYKLNEWYNKFKKVTGKTPTKYEFRNISDYYTLSSISIFLVFEGFWIIFGLITSNWFLFILIVLYGKITSLIFNRVRYTLIGKIGFLQFLIIKTALYAFMIISHFHIGLDLYEVFKGSLLSL